jgi:3-hydroxymyristoyl/3-hydroxydecanoyl-(acyl carrier protein) dehydratase
MTAPEPRVLRHTLSLATDHPTFAGHFPGAPILPGVVLLDAALRAAATAIQAEQWQIVTAKFHQVVRPGEVLTLEHESLPNGTVQFRVLHIDRLVASGTLKPSPSAERRDG